MQAAALVVRNGGNPVGTPYLRSEGVELMVWDHVLRLVADQARQSDKRHWQNMRAVVAGGVAQALARLLRRT